MVNEPEWFQQVLDRTEQTESNLTKRTNTQQSWKSTESNQESISVKIQRAFLLLPEEKQR